MKSKRNIWPMVAVNQSKLEEYINKKEVVIYIEGELYEEMEKKAKSSIKDKKYKTLSKIAIIGGLFTGGLVSALALISGGLLYTSSSLTDGFKNYNVKINESKRRIELYLAKGENKYNPKYDTILIKL